MHEVTFIRNELVAKNTYTFWFEPKHPLRFIAGQFTEIYLPHSPADQRGEKRWFTISSSPTDKHISITTKLLPKHSSFKQTLASLIPGTTVRIASPMGDFVVPKNPNTPLLFVAVGIGCTPFHSIIKYLHDTNQQRKISMIYSDRTSEDLVFLDTFNQLGDALQLYTKQASPANPNEMYGIITTQVIQKHTDSNLTHIYIAGPEPVVEKLTKELVETGHPTTHIQTDFFPGYEA